MARRARQTNPSDVANAFIRCLLSDAGQMLGGLSNEEWAATLEHFDHRCPYSGEPITAESAVMDHAIPINRQHCGLHLYGNVLPCTQAENTAKHHRHYRDFVTDPERLDKIESFITRSGYWEQASLLGDLQAYCKTQYEMINGLCQVNRSYLERITGGDEDVAPGVAPGDDPPVREVLPISLEPAPATLFKEELLRTKAAWITIFYKDGTQEVREWRADNFRPESNVFGNLRSRPEFRQGEWQQQGIARAKVSIAQPDAQ